MQTRNINVTYGGQSFVGFDFSSLPLAAALTAAAMQIDQAADQSRSAVLGDPLRAVEYRLTAEEAESFAAAGYAGEVPATVQAWMDAAGLDAHSATESILHESHAWKGVIYAIRAERLKGKQDVLKATSHEQAEALADVAIAAIKACIQGVGNAT
ncbi:hypothetical protein LH705_18330 [Pseudomonas putida]|uniref:hypothetical protein n=2 Tax=Pseudomonas putida group TaxID=136845 RepID=UPI001F221BA9|nr:hypothetical protein [Pseudomonas putida]MCF1251490.1 hypothetical protein [Pseudomonas putida]